MKSDNLTQLRDQAVAAARKAAESIGAKAQDTVKAAATQIRDAINESAKSPRSQPRASTTTESDDALGFSPGVGAVADPLRWGQTFPEATHSLMRNTQLRRNLMNATSTIQNKRNTRAEELPDWEELREAASSIKTYTMAHLPQLLEQMERNVTARGGVVHWARDAQEANEIIYSIVAAQGVSEVVKVKSMVTQEINMNSYLAERGVTAWETDLAEMIVQLSNDQPSHFVVPAIHRNRSEVRAIFSHKMNGAGHLSDDPRELTMAARSHLRQKFLEAKVAISGSNMMIAESGTLTVLESEGNGRMCLTLPQTLISVVGIEKIVPTFRDAEVFAQLLPRSATGERMNPYTSWWTGVTPGDGPQEFHLVLIDNGRTRALADPVGCEALNCIRCGACLNGCPVYQRVGGHAYGSVYPGPIGVVLTPQLLDATDHSDPASSLPYACSLCNNCADQCPVHIDLPAMIVNQRKKNADANRMRTIPTAWDAAMRASARVMGSGAMLDGVAGRGHYARAVAGEEGRFGFVPLPVLATWTKNRDLPAPPAQTLRQWWESQGKDVQ